MILVAWSVSVGCFWRFGRSGEFLVCSRKDANAGVRGVCRPVSSRCWDGVFSLHHLCGSSRGIFADILLKIGTSRSRDTHRARNRLNYVCTLLTFPAKPGVGVGKSAKSQGTECRKYFLAATRRSNSRKHGLLLETTYHMPSYLSCLKRHTAYGPDQPKRRQIGTFPVADKICV